jgi:hypothetical protein
LLNANFDVISRLLPNCDANETFCNEDAEAARTLQAAAGERNRAAAAEV